MNGVCIIHMGYSFVEKGEYEWCIYVYMRCSFVEKGEYEWSVYVYVRHKRVCVHDSYIRWVTHLRYSGHRKSIIY